MAFIRRGNIRVPHKPSAYIILHRFDDTPVRIQLSQLQCWEEHKHKTYDPVTMVYWGVASATAVRESFSEINRAINGTGVANV